MPGKQRVSTTWIVRAAVAAAMTLLVLEFPPTAIIFVIFVGIQAPFLASQWVLPAAFVEVFLFWLIAITWMTPKHRPRAT